MAFKNPYFPQKYIPFNNFILFHRMKANNERKMRFINLSLISAGHFPPSPQSSTLTLSS